MSDFTVDEILREAEEQDRRGRERLAEMLRSCAKIASEGAALTCSHEAYQGRCVHCNASFVDGRIYIGDIRPSIYVYHDADNLKSAIDHPSMHSVVFSTKRLAGLRNETKLYER